jgi:hypothetical protein
MPSATELIAELSLRSKEEVVEQLRELIKRHRRRYIKRFMRPCPNNCQTAEVRRNRVIGCDGCGSSNPEQCTKESAFVPINTKEELAQDFAEDIHDLDVLRHDYRDLMILMWMLGIPLGENSAVEQVVSIAEV